MNFFEEIKKCLKFINIHQNSKNSKKNKVGAWNNAMVNNLNKDKNMFLISFEPLLDKYANIIDEANDVTDPKNPGFRRTRRVLGHQHERGIILPFALSTNEVNSESVFHISDVDQSSSLLECDNSLKDNDECKSKEERHVRTLTLEFVMKMIPQKFRISFLKIDAQGMDLDIVKSAKDEIKRVERICVEAVKYNEKNNKHYKNAPFCDEIKEEIEKLDFVAHGECLGLDKGSHWYCISQNSGWVFYFFRFQIWVWNLLNWNLEKCTKYWKKKN